MVIEQASVLGPIAVVLDLFGISGTAEGWALYRDNDEACHIKIFVNGVFVGQDIADRYRRDLLLANVRHGFYAFRVDLPQLDPGLSCIQLIDGRSGVVLYDTVMEFTSEKDGESSPYQLVTLEAQSWADQDILLRLECLNLDRNLGEMGVEKFVDSTFRFALGRWADPPALDAYGNALLTGRLSPEALLRTVLTSSERSAQIGRRLPGPRDPEFPFQCYTDHEALPLLAFVNTDADPNRYGGNLPVPGLPLSLDPD